MSTQEETEKFEQELEGIRRLRRGVLYLLLTPLLIIAALVMGGNTDASVGGTEDVAAGVLFMVALVLVALAFSSLRASFKKLAAVVKGAGRGSTGVILVLVGVVIVIVGAFVGGVSLFNNEGFLITASLVLYLAGIIVAVVGFFLIGVGLYAVGTPYGNGMLKVGGTLVAIPLFLTPFIGLILSYVGLGEIESRLTSSAQASAVNQTSRPP
ncbi:DUF973 family protein [Acidilobus sp.]|uniref:DUF973 family protein n=1 Tax=Acidilobus sp. TaxID=1872109 RepID=UPI003D0742A6